MTWIELLDKLSPLLGVLIGGVIGLLIPGVTNRFEKRKRKKSIKYELISSIYTLFKLMQLYTNSVNIYWFYHSRIELNKKLGITTKSDDKDEASRVNYNEKMHTLYFQQVELESKIIALAIETQDFYRKKYCDIVKKLINAAIEKSHKGDFRLFNYPALNREELEETVSKFSDVRNEKLNQLQDEANALIADINSNLK